MLFPQLQQQLAEILPGFPGFRSGISQQHYGGCLPKIGFKYILLKAALIYSSLKWMCLPEQKKLSLSPPPPLLFLSCAPLHSVTHFIPIFTSVSAGPAAINCVPDWDHREKCGWECWVCTREARQGWAQLSPGEEVALSYRCPHPSPRMIT